MPTSMRHLFKDFSHRKSSTIVRHSAPEPSQTVRRTMQDESRARRHISDIFWKCWLCILLNFVDGHERHRHPASPFQEPRHTGTHSFGTDRSQPPRSCSSGREVRPDRFARWKERQTVSHGSVLLRAHQWLSTTARGPSPESPTVAVESIAAERSAYRRE